MKNLFIISAIFLFLNSCDNSSNNMVKSNNADSIGLTNPSVIDTVKHPSGIDNSSVISTDTAAMNTQNAIERADSVERKKSNKK